MSNELLELKQALRLLLPYRTDSDEIDEAIEYIEQRIQNLIEEAA
jgi:signal transduction protein with GAF and PtsI domain